MGREAKAGLRATERLAAGGVRRDGLGGADCPARLGAPLVRRGGDRSVTERCWGWASRVDCRDGVRDARGAQEGGLVRQGWNAGARGSETRGCGKRSASGIATGRDGSRPYRWGTSAGLMRTIDRKEEAG